MKKSLSILKPQVHNAIIENEVMEKVSYLSIPSAVNVKSLKADVKKGAVQFSELEQLIEKENEPKYILISTNNLEQGYLAVTYLAAGFNKKHGVNLVPDPEEDADGVNHKIESWIESPLEIPLIEDHELRQAMVNGDNNSPFSMNDFFMQGNQRQIIHTPYWMNCLKESVCIVAKDYGLGMGGMNAFIGSDFFESGLEHFRGNNKVYILHIDQMIEHCMEYRAEEEEEDDEQDYLTDSTRGKWNHLVLSFSADEASVYLKKESVKKYYKLLFQGNFAAKNISVKRGISYERLVNIVMAMRDDNKCTLIENIVKYAVKDWKSAEERSIENKDFDFMDRFCRAYHAELNGKTVKKRSARERMLQELVGMEDVKKQVLNVVNVMKYNQIRTKMGIPGGGYHNVHVMLGAPGTAKTTIAQLMGEIMVEEHLLLDDRFTCVNGAELKGMYVGHSAPKTKMLFEENDIIVIDEAYSLVGDHGENDPFSKEAIAQLIIELENHSMDKLVIFAGYGGKMVNEKNNKMKDFLDANPGIKSRITSTIYFDSYSPDEMVQIFFQIAINNRYHVDETVREMLYTHFRKRVLDDNFGNGREARSLLETSVIYTANRVLEQKKKSYTKAEMQTIKHEDVAAAIRQLEYADSVQSGCREARAIGFAVS